MRSLILWTACLVTLAGCERDPCNPNPCSAGETCQPSAPACGDRPDFFRERFLGCFNEKEFCSGRGKSCEAFCAEWMGCTGPLEINEAGEGTVTGTARREAVCVGPSTGDGGSPTTDGGSPTDGGSGGAGPSAACLALNDAGTTLGSSAAVVTVGAALNAGEHVTVIYDYQGTATDTPYVLTAYWSNGTATGVSDAGDPRVIVWEQHVDGQSAATAPAAASGITLTCAADCHVGWNVTFACTAP